MSENTKTYGPDVLSRLAEDDEDAFDLNKKEKDVLGRALENLVIPVEQLVTRHSHCEWLRDDDGIYETECGNMFELIEGTTVENGMVFCPYCAGLLNAV